LAPLDCPHVIVRFFTVPKVSDARKSAGYALIFIALLYTTAPAVGAFARLNFVDTVHNTQYTEVAGWFKSWENIGLIGWEDKNEDGRIQYHPGAPFEGKPTFGPERRADGSRDVLNTPTTSDNEVYVDRDIMVLANPEIAALPDWVIALVAAGSSSRRAVDGGRVAAGDIDLGVARPDEENLRQGADGPARAVLCPLAAAVTAIGIAGYLGIDPPGFVAQVVAFAFGLAAASLFPAILLGIFDKRMNREGAIVGMLAGLLFSLFYIAYFKFISPETNNAAHWFLGISPEGIGTVGALINVSLALVISRCTAPVPEEVVRLVDNIRIPNGVGQAQDH
jgi:cation/acetate symporter